MVFIFRNPQTELSNFYAVNDRMLFAFKVVHDQINVKDAAKMSGQSVSSVKTILKESAEIGFILLPKSF
jgi:transposase